MTQDHDGMILNLFLFIIAMGIALALGVMFGALGHSYWRGEDRIDGTRLVLDEIRIVALQHDLLAQRCAVWSR